MLRRKIDDKLFYFNFDALKQRIQTEIEEFPHSFQVGSIIYLTDNLKIALMQEIGNWKLAYGKAMNEKGKRIAFLNRLLSFMK